MLPADEMAREQSLARTTVAAAQPLGEVGYASTSLIDEECDEKANAQYCQRPSLMKDGRTEKVGGEHSL
jgi:hypothetical protein